MSRIETLCWGSIFLLLGAFNALIFTAPWSRWAAPAIGLLLILYSYVRFKPYTFLKVGLALVFLGDEFLLFAFGISLVPVLLLLKSRSGFVVSRPQKRIALLFLWCFVSYVFAQYIELNLGSLWFYAVTFGSPMVLFPIAVQVGTEGDRAKALFGFLKMCTLWQTAFIGYLGLVLGNYTQKNDWATGSLGQPDIAFLLAGFLIFLSAPWVLKRASLRNAGYPVFSARHRWVYLAGVGWFALMLYWTYTRVLNYSLILAFAVGLSSLLLFRKLRPVLRCRRLVCTGGVLASLAIFLIYGLLTLPSTTFGATYTIYLTDPDYNHKVVFLRRALEEIPEEFGTWLTGTGPGTVGTRAANSRAYDTLFKISGSKLPSFIPPFTSAPARQFFVDLYQQDFAVKYWKSQTLAGPFSSIISLWVELGFIGFVIFLCIMGTLARSFLRLSEQDSDPFYRTLGITLYLATLTLLIVAIFDTYLERPRLMSLYWITAGLAVGRLRAIRKQVDLQHSLNAAPVPTGQTP